LSTILDAITSFVDQLGLGLLPLPPKSDTLDGHVPDLSGLARDAEGIICQVQKDNLDGGDSAHREGVAAFCNSRPDMALLPRFETGGIMVRHPTQEPWNNWKNCTRDQLIGYVAGCWRAGRADIAQRLLQAHATRNPPFTCQNTENDSPGTTKNPPIGDPLAPDNVMFLRIGAGDNAAYMDVLGQFTLQLGIELADKDIKTDKTNLILHTIVCGRLNLLVQVLPNYQDAIRYYWSGWRQQPRIAEEFIWVIDQELKRYPKVTIPLLPMNLLTLLRGLDVTAELKNLDPAHHAQLAGRFLEASLKDAANTFVNVMKLGVDQAVGQLNKLSATADQIAKALADVGQAPNSIRSGLKALGVPDNQIAKAMQTAFPGIPHIDAVAVPHIDTVAVPHHDVAPVHQDVAAIHVDVRTPHTDARSPHADGSVLGAHGDVGGVHGDVGGIHTDMATTPHVDVKSPHLDVPAAVHVDVPPVGHVDTP
jgi:hypothetical protein